MRNPVLSLIPPSRQHPSKLLDLRRIVAAGFFYREKQIQPLGTKHLKNYKIFEHSENAVLFVVPYSLLPQKLTQTFFLVCRHPSNLWDFRQIAVGRLLDRREQIQALGIKHFSYKMLNHFRGAILFITYTLSGNVVFVFQLSHL